MTLGVTRTFTEKEVYYCDFPRGCRNFTRKNPVRASTLNENTEEVKNGWVVVQVKEEGMWTVKAAYCCIEHFERAGILGVSLTNIEIENNAARNT